MINKRTIQIATPYMGSEEWQALREPLETGWLTQGPKVAAFEKAFAEYHGVRHALATTSCTTALHLALLAVGVAPGDFVVVPSFTWVATANAVEYCGAIPLFCDINPYTFNIDADNARHVIISAISRGCKVKAIVPVHLFGLYADMDAIMRLAREFNLKVVEDAACAAGASYHGKTAGAIGDIGCFSFHPRKVLVTGEGGMCATNDDKLADRINCLRNHGASLSEEQRHQGNAPYLLPDFNIRGYNYRMTDLQGAIGLIQLTRLKGFIEEREKWATFYDRELNALGWLRPPARTESCAISWQAYVCAVDESKAPLSRNQLMVHLQEMGISTRPGTQAVHMLGYYREKYNLHEDHFSAAKSAYYHSIALPLHNCMSEYDYHYVVDVLRSL